MQSKSVNRSRTRRGEPPKQQTHSGQYPTVLIGAGQYTQRLEGSGTPVLDSPMELAARASRVSVPARPVKATQLLGAVAAGHAIVVLGHVDKEAEAQQFALLLRDTRHALP